MKRIGIFFFYDKLGKVDRYVQYLLKDIKKHFSRLIIVVNGDLSSSEKENLSSFGEVLIRPNEGFDVGAYKHALANVGWETLEEYDELIMFNSTIIGPVESFDDTFIKMDAQPDLDFWGITEFFQTAQDPFGTSVYGYIPDHIQSHFIAVRENLFNSTVFHEYWDNMEKVHSYEEAVGFHEVKFTKYFSDLGYSWDTSVDMEDLRNVSVYPLMTNPKEMLKERKCPIFKKKNFFRDDVLNILYSTEGEETKELYDYLVSIGFDTGMIWETIIPRYDQADIARNLGLAYVLPNEKEKLKLKQQKLNIAMLIELESQASLDIVDKIPENVDAYFLASGELINKKSSIFQKKNFHFLNFEKESVLSNLKKLSINYDILGFVRNNLVYDETSGTVSLSEFKQAMDDIVGTEDYISDIISTFEENSYLGLLVPPTPLNYNTFYRIQKEFSEFFPCIKKFYEDKNLGFPIDSRKQPLSPILSMFWVRTDSVKEFIQTPELKKIFKKNNGKLTSLGNWLIPYSVQQAGFYSAYVMSREHDISQFYSLRAYLSILFDEVENNFENDIHYTLIKISNLNNQVKQLEELVEYLNSTSKSYSKDKEELLEKNIELKEELTRLKSSKLFKFMRKRRK